MVLVAREGNLHLPRDGQGLGSGDILLVLVLLGKEGGGKRR